MMLESFRDWMKLKLPWLKIKNNACRKEKAISHAANILEELLKKY
jgi:hypothetical protein